jgi:hypothetical protein
MRAPDLTVTLSSIVVQYLTLIFHQHTEAKDVITSKKGRGTEKWRTRIVALSKPAGQKNGMSWEVQPR